MNQKPLAFVLATLVAVLLQGCLEIEPPVWTGKPPFAPLGVSFTDTSLGQGIGGAIEIVRAADESGLASYVIRWGIGGLPAGDEDGNLTDGSHNFIAQVNKDRADAVFYIAPNTPIPDGVDSIVVTSYNPLGESDDSVYVTIDNLVYIPRTPETRATELSVTDSDETARIYADIAFTPAANQDDIETYFLRYAGEDGCPIGGQTVAEFPATEAFSIAGAIDSGYPPNNATNLLVMSGNSDGEHGEDDCSNYLVAPGDSWNYINYDQPARFAPAAVSVTDVSDGLDVELIIDVEAAQYEIDIRHYSVYLGSGGTCTLLGNLPRGGGTLTANVAYEDYALGVPSVFNPAWVTYPNQIITVVSDGENCNQYPQLTKTYTEFSGDWFLIYHVNPTEAPDIESHYDRIDIAYDAAIYDDWNADCLQVSLADDTEVVVAACDKQVGQQRFRITSKGDAENLNDYVIQSLYNDLCFQRTNDEGEHDWQMAACNEGQSQTMTFTADATETSYLKVSTTRTTDPAQSSCTIATSGRDDVFGTWNNCEATTDIFWQFWPQAMPSLRNRF
ncbi:MAG: RICIN domain-containing protein [Pseudomonadales bacterium]|nr:RICIN domain-containing protein [Pseudomonadales bacterium]